MDRDPAFKEWLDRQPKCEECGKPQTTIQKHYEHCSKFEHIVDDHYDSPCMRGTCKHCFPNYVAKVTMEVTEQEKSLIKALRDPGSSMAAIYHHIKKVAAFFKKVH